MPRTLYQLGEFQFNLPNGAPEKVGRDLQWRWPRHERIGRKPAFQFLGPDADRITLDGELFPGNQPGCTGGQGTIDTLRAMADEGEPVMFTDGLGRVYGRFAIINIREKRDTLMDTGAARKIKFKITIVEYGEDKGRSDVSMARTANPSFISQVLGNAEDINFSEEGSAIALTDWTNLTDFGADLSTLEGAVFAIPQVAAAAQAAGGPAEVAPALGALGAGGELTPTQQSAWQAAGINPTALLQSMAGGQGPPAAAVGLDALRTAGGNALAGVAGPALGGVTGLVNNAATLTGLFNVDPRATANIGNLLRLN